jgi:ATP-dependent DNA helicase RecG
MALHINIEDLLSARTVESDRIEYKQGWNPDAICRSICAFANDFENIGGGYLLIGVSENIETKTANRPVKGLSTKEIGEIQKEMITLNNAIRPYYAPKLFIEEVDNKHIIVLWVLPGNERPYEVPETITAKHKVWKYFIRKYASSIEAKNADKEELISLSNNIPFDDRANTQASVNDISMVLVQNHLRKIESKLADDIGKLNSIEIQQQMALLSGPEEHLFPRNVGLMMFSEDPSKHFPYTQVEIVYFPDGEANPFTEYQPIKGPIPEQIKRTLDFLKTNFLEERIIKPKDRAESTRIWNYPLQAIEETLVNAFYHRDYQQREPIEIRIYPNSIIFINQGGPDRSIQLQAFNTGLVRSRRYRNRRLGEFLKELELTEGRATGIPTIHKALKDNSSPEPRFNSDDNRTFFEVELFIHPTFIQKLLLTIDISSVVWDLQGINTLLDKILLLSGYDNEGGIVSGIARGIAEFTLVTGNQVFDIIKQIDRDIVGGIAGGIASGIAEKVIQILKLALSPKSRKELLEGILIVNNANNFENYIQPLEGINWLTMTIPHKPTSPNQKYLTTLKGRLVLEILKHKIK